MKFIYLPYIRWPFIKYLNYLIKFMRRLKSPNKLINGVKLLIEQAQKKFIYLNKSTKNLFPG